MTAGWFFTILTMYFIGYMICGELSEIRKAIERK